jgi:pseudouridine-5'-monophosphatase
VTRKYGKPFTWNLKQKVTCTGIESTSNIVTKEFDLPITAEEFQKMCENEFPKVYSNCSLMPGVQRLLEHLYKHKIPCAIATGSSNESYHRKTDKFGPSFQKYWHHVLTARGNPEVNKPKPAPDTFLACKNHFSPVPESSQCLVFEDSIPGVISACRAGMQVVWVPDPRLDYVEALANNPELKPIQILKTIEDFKPEDFGLPIYDSC